MGKETEPVLVKIMNTTTVQSAATLKPITQRHISLPAFDTFWRTFPHNRCVLFYKPPQLSASHPAPSNPQKLNFIQTLKQSLSKALIHYYPWSGRLAIDDRKQFVIDCNDNGVEFIEAKLESVAMAELEEADFPIRPWFQQLSKKLHMDVTDPEAMFTCPLLSVQVTEFNDGGMALGFSTCHVACDGLSVWQFLVGWGECARLGAPLFPPVHTRELIVDRLKNVLLAEKASKWNPDPELDSDDEPLDDCHEDPADTVDDAEHDDDILTTCIVHVSGEAIRGLKESFDGKFSSYEIVCSHFWQRITVARCIQANQKLLLVSFVDFRNRLEPALPNGYFGNAVVPAYAASRSGHVASSGRFAAIASRIRRSVQEAVQLQNIQAFVDWHRDGNSRRAPPDFRFRVNVANSPRFPVYEVDFGWGHPSASRPIDPGCDGQLFFLPGRPGCSGPGDMEICVTLSARAMRRLIRDPQFIGVTRGNPV